MWSAEDKVTHRHTHWHTHSKTAKRYGKDEKKNENCWECRRSVKVWATWIKLECIKGVGGCVEVFIYEYVFFGEV